MRGRREKWFQCGFLKNVNGDVMKRIRTTPKPTLLMIFFIVSIGWKAPIAAGEKYSDQGRKLAAEIDRQLISRGLCKDSKDCYDKLPMYGEYGNRVNFNIYDMDDPNKRFLAAIAMEIVIKHGTNLTGGVPIFILAFPKPHDEYVNFKNFFSKKPTIRLEVTE